MSMINVVLNLVFLVLAVAIVGVAVMSLFHALRTPAGSFASAGKLNKNLWLLILALATLFSLGSAWAFLNALLWIGGGAFVGLSAIGIFSIAAVIAAVVYQVDVKPAVNGMGRGGGNNGPYGPW